MRTILLRSTTAAALAVCCSFSVYGVGKVPTSATSTANVVAISAGLPLANSCSNANQLGLCVSVPLEVTQNTQGGSKTTVPVDVSISRNVVSQVKRQFPDSASTVFRNLAQALKKGLSESNPGVKRACRAALPAVQAHVHYQVLPDAKMTIGIEAKIAQIANKDFELSNKNVTVTSGTRTPESQASAIHEKIALGDNLSGLYKDKHAVGQILHAYRQAKHEGKGPEEVTDAMAEVIQRQVEGGVYISNHLRDNAVDLRISDLNGWQKRVLKHAAESIPGVSVHEEAIPPHFHLDIL